MDDDKNFRHSLVLYLTSNSWKVDEAVDGLQGWQKLKNNSYDVVITDIEMPGVDGLSLVENIRASNALIPIVIVPAHTDKDYLLRPAHLQIDGYITKPLNFKKLKTTLARAVSRLQHRVQAITISKAVSDHPLEKELRVDDQEVSLGNKECLLLELLL